MIDLVDIKSNHQSITCLGEFLSSQPVGSCFVSTDSGGIDVIQTKKILSSYGIESKKITHIETTGTYLLSISEEDLNLLITTRGFCKDDEIFDDNVILVFRVVPNYD